MKKHLSLALFAACLLACGSSSSSSAGTTPAAEGASGSGTTEARMHHQHGHHHDFSDVERFQAIFDDPERDGWQRPAEVVSMLELAEGMTVADLGAGTGYFLPHLSPEVGESGHVFGLDVEENMVSHMRERASEAGLANVQARTVTPEDPGFAPASVDRVLIVDTWHHIAERAAYAARLREALRPGGFVLVVDFTRDAPHGPPPAMRLPPEVVAAELEEGGLHTEILDEDLPRQYVVRARRD